MATRTISNAGGSWNTVGAWVEGAVPLASDDVVATATSGALTVTAASVCRSMDLTGYTSTISGSGDLSIGDASGGLCKLAGTISGSWTTTFKSTSTNGGVGWGITSNGKNFPGSVTFNGVGGKWVLQDAFALAAGFQLAVSQGSFFGNGQSISAQTFTSSVPATRTVDITNCTVTLSSTWTTQTTTGLTLTTTGSTIAVGSGGIFQGGGKTYATVTITGFTGSANVDVVGCTFTNLSITGGAGKLAVASITGAFTVTGTLTLAGNTTQGVNRLLVSSNTLGTQRTITTAGAAVVISGDVDFMDIEISSVASWTNAGSAYIGDALGNGTNVVSKRTAPLTLYRVGAGGNWSASQWALASGGVTGQRVPLPQDAVFVDGNASGTINGDMLRRCADLTFTGFTGTWQPSTSVGYGSLTLGAGMTITSSSGQVTLQGRGTHTITMNAVQFAQGLSMQNPSGTYTLQDAMVTTGLTLTGGTFATAGQSVTLVGSASSFALGSCTLASGGSTFTLGAQSGNAWNNNTGSAPVTGSPNIVFSAASTSSRSILGGGKTFGTVTYTVASSPGALVIAGANTFATINVGSGRSLTLPSGSTTTITSGFNVNGASNGYLYLPGVSGNYASTPDSAALSITGDVTVLCRVALDDWTPAVFSTLAGKWGNAGASTESYVLGVQSGSTGKLQFSVSHTGATQVDAVSSIAPTIADGAVLWVLASWRLSDGRVQFFTASGAIADPVASDFVALGADQTANVGTLADTSAPVEIGTLNAGAAGNAATGKFYRAMIYNGVFSTAAFGGTKQFDADFTRSLATTGWLDAAKTQFSESSTNAATVTINGALAQAGDGRVVLNSSSAGSAATLSSTVSQTVTGVSIKDSTATGGGTWTDLAAFANVSGNTGWLFVQPLTAAGSLSTAGAAAPKTLMVPTASGTMSTAGAAAVTTLMPAVASGVMVTDGSGSIATSLSSSADGTLSTAGIAAPTVEFAPTAAATMVTGGAGSISASLTVDAAGIVTLDGSGAATAILAAYAAGLLTTAGTGSTVMTLRASAVGSLATAGSGQIALTWRPTASGTLTTAGTARMAVVGTASFRVDVGADSTFHTDVGADVSFGVEVDRRA